MKRVMILVCSLITTVFFSTTASLAEEVKGEIVKMDGSRLVVKVDGRGSRSFEVTRKTRIFAKGMPAPTKHLLPNSRVKVAGKSGKADWIFVEETPK